MASELAGTLIDRDKNPIIIGARSFLESMVTPSDSVADIGCADGHYSLFISDFCKEVIGIDYDPDLIAVANRNKNKKNVTFYVGDAITFFEKSTEIYDVIICSHILEHLDQPKEFLSKFMPYFRNIYVEVPDNDVAIISHYRNIIGISPLYSDSDHIWEFSRADMFSILRELGLEIVKSEFSFGVMRFWARNLSIK